MKNKKVAIVTGTNRGIGKEVAYGLAEEGFHVVLIARNKNKLIELQNEIKKYSTKIDIIVGDITEFETVNEQVNQLLKNHGRCDVLVNNAGIFMGGTLDASLEDYQQLFDVNFKAQLALIKTVIPYMKKQGNGYIFNISSIAGKIGYANIGAYTSSKFALVGLTESLHAEYSSQGIKVTSICPSWVNTDMAKGAPISVDEMITPKDILQTIRWILSLSSGAFIKEVVIDTAEK